MENRTDFQIGGVRVSDTLSNSDINGVLASLASVIDEVFEKRLESTTSSANHPTRRDKHVYSPLREMVRLLNNNIFIFKKNKSNESSTLKKTLQNNGIQHAIFSNGGREKAKHINLKSNGKVSVSELDDSACFQIVEDLFKPHNPRVLLLNREFPDFDTIQTMYSKPTKTSPGFIQYEYNAAVATKYFLLLFSPVQVKVKGKNRVLMSLELTNNMMARSNALWEFHKASLNKIKAENTMISTMVNSVKEKQAQAAPLTPSNAKRSGSVSPIKSASASVSPIKSASASVSPIKSASASQKTSTPKAGEIVYNTDAVVSNSPSNNRSNNQNKHKYNPTKVYAVPEKELKKQQQTKQPYIVSHPKAANSVSPKAATLQFNQSPGNYEVRSNSDLTNKIIRRRAENIKREANAMKTLEAPKGKSKLAARRRLRTRTTRTRSSTNTNKTQRPSERSSSTKTKRQSIKSRSRSTSNQATAPKMGHVAAMRQRFLNMEGKKISVAGRGKTHKSKTRKAKPF
jgi:hypothetical protein